MTEAARAADVNRRRGARVLRPPVDIGRRPVEREDLNRAPVRIAHPERAVAVLANVRKRAHLLERAVVTQLEPDVVEARVGAGDELEAVRLVVAGEV